MKTSEIYHPLYPEPVRICDKCLAPEPRCVCPGHMVYKAENVDPVHVVLMSDYRCDKCVYWGAATKYEDPEEDDDFPPGSWKACALTECPDYDGEPAHPKSLALASGTEGPAVLYTVAGFSCSQWKARARD